MIMDALKAYKIPQTLTSAYAKEGSIPMGGTMPPAVTMNKPSGSVTDNLGLDYPPKGDVTMTATQKQLGGERLSVPEANTVPGNTKSEEQVTAGAKPDQKPGSAGMGTFPTAVGSDATKITGMGTGNRTSLTPGSGDKGTFTATNDPADSSGSALPGAPFKGEEDEEAKAFKGLFVVTKAFGKYGNGIFSKKAKMMLEDALSQYSQGMSARQALEEIKAKIEEALSGVGQTPLASNPASPQMQPASAGPQLGTEEAGGMGGMQGAGMPGASPMGAGPGASMAPPQAPGASMGPGMTEEDMMAVKALHALGEGLTSGKLTLKQYDEAISSVFQPKGGSDNFTNLRTPGQPPGKVAASPGRSGSSEVFRTDTGSKGGVGMTRDAQTNPPATLETAKDEPLGTYETETKLTSGPGFQMDILRNLSDSDIRKRGMPGASTRVHPTLVKFFNVRSNEERALGEHASKESVPTLPSGMETGTLKFIQSSHVPTKEELSDLATKGELDSRLLQKAQIETDDQSRKEKNEGILMKGLKRIVDS